MKLKFWSNLRSKSREVKESLTQIAIAGLNGLGEIWPDRNYKNFAEEVYMKNVIGFRCIDYIARSFSSVPWKLFNQISEDEREIVNNHPINQLLKRANPDTSFNFLTYEYISYLCLDGNTYMERVAPETGPNKDIPQELYTLRPDRMKILINPETGQKKGYEHEVL
jgi:phage portal protein BeeE